MILFYKIKQVLIGIILTSITLTSLSALTASQANALAKLKVKFGKGVLAEFYNSNSTILRNMRFDVKLTEYRGRQTYISAADSIINELEPYLQTRTVALNPAQSQEDEVIYSQKKFGDFNFEENLAVLRIRLLNTYVIIGNTLIYDYNLPKPPYLSKDRALEIADSTYWKDLCSERDTDNKSQKDVGPGFVFISEIVQKIEDLKTYRESIDLLVCSATKPNGDVFHKLAYKVTYIQGYVVKVDAKTGEAIFHQGTIKY